jgi:hypothetical protein
MSFTVYISESKEFDQLSILDSSAILGTNENINEIINNRTNVYTSFEDLTVTNFIKLLDICDEVVYLNSDKENFHTKIYLNFYSKFKKITNYNRDTYSNKIIHLQDSRKIESPQLWVVGCSFADGYGVEKNKRFGKILADKLNLEVSFLTLAGSSIEWAADQILRSDIRPNDILIWGITGVSRMSFFDEDHNIKLITESNWNKFPILDNYFRKSIIISQNMFCKAVLDILKVKNFLEKIKCKYVFGVLPINIQDLEDQMLDFTSKIDNSILLYDNNIFVDYAEDNLHPGPKQHQLYAEKILNFLKL